MRIACIYLPYFYVQVERLKVPGIEGRPVIIGGMPEERNSVADCSEEAAAQGIHPGMAVREAYYLCPDALFLPFSNRYERIWEDILFALGAFTLKIEPEKPGLAYLDTTKASMVYGDERAMVRAIIRDMAESSQLKARIGVGNSRFIAKQAALCAWDTLIIEPGGEKEFLSLLPTEALSLSEKEEAYLRLLGLSNLKKVAGLSRKALVSQFGRAGGTLWETVNGVDEKRPIPRWQSVICLEREFTSETPFQTSRELRTILEDMVTDLSGELNRMGMTCRKVKLILWLQDGRSVEKDLVMKKPVAEARQLFRRIADFLESLVVGSPVVSFLLRIPDPVPGGGDQEDLFRRRSVFAERLEGIRAYLDARYGYTPLMRIEEGEGGSRLPERRFRFIDA